MDRPIGRIKYARYLLFRWVLSYLICGRLLQRIVRLCFGELCRKLPLFVEAALVS